MIGKRSITNSVLVNNSKNPIASFEVVVQVNKNGGICDVILPKTQAKPIKPVDTSRERQFVRIMLQRRSMTAICKRDLLCAQRSLTGIKVGSYAVPM